jgi:arylsulfatase A-like enzyme
VDARLPGRSLLDPPCRVGTFTELHGSGYELVQRAPAYMWRTSEWKLILYLPGDLPGAMVHLNQVRGELYHLAEDPHEWNNLYDAPEYLGMRDEMTRQLLMHLACAWAAYPGQAMRARLGR